MYTVRRVVLGLNGATVLLVIGGILLLVAPTRVPAGRPVTSPLASTGALPDSVRQPAADLGAAERVVRTDIFSSRRTAPSRRSVFGEPATEPDAAPSETSSAPLAGEPMDSTAASTANDAVPHLYGTMLGAAESTALLRLDPRVSEPRLYRIGDRAGGYRVAEIGDRSVTLIGSSGRVVLRMKHPDE
jgi:hypothetical protein